MRQLPTLTALLLCAAAAAQSTAKIDVNPGSGFTIDGGDEFSVRIFNPFQAVWKYEDLDGGQDTSDFDLRRARTQFDGHVWDEDFTFRLMLEWATTDKLLETWFRWKFWESEDDDDAVSLRVGRQRPHHGREFACAVFKTEHVDRSISARTFSGRRVVGAWLLGSHFEGGKLHWAVGAGNGDGGATEHQESGNSAFNPDNELTYYFDMRFDPFGDFTDEDFELSAVDRFEGTRGTVGAAVMIGNHRGTGVLNNRDIDSTSINLYTQWRFDRFHTIGEVFLRSDDPDAPATGEADNSGWTVSAGYTLPPAEEGGGQWGFAGRVSQVIAHDEAAVGPPVVVNPVRSPIVDGMGIQRKGDVTEIEATVTRYINGHSMRAQIGYRFQLIDFDSPAVSDQDNNIVEVQFQWMF